MTPSILFNVVDERVDSDAIVFTVVVPEDCPFFEGHFPGRPILPAIGQLAMLTELAERATGAAETLMGVDDLRLTLQILPGDRVEIRLVVPDSNGKARFEILRDGATVSRGALRFTVGATQ